MKRTKKILSFLLMVCMIITAIPFATSTAAVTDPYEQSLLDQGWPADYAKALTKLHYAHPNWVFIMDDITQLSRDYGTSAVYTWDYVLYQEYDASESRNLISSYYADSQPAYRKNSNTYDSGLYPASEACVKFFLDPRNFLDERNIFQFEVLEYNDSMTVELIEDVLAGTFMANAVIPGSDNTQGLTYAQYIVQVAQELNLSALQMASRLRSEQGVAGTNPLISGVCGDNLWTMYANQTDNAPSSGYTEASLKAYNGYYNYFNMDAAGDGYFNIRLNAMKEAANGGWNTRMKAIKGGAAKYKARYIDQQQYIPYYFKFNVRPGTDRNFWGQYMQSMPGAYADGRRMQESYAEFDLLDNVHTFYIPVYEGMDATPTSDPGTFFTDGTSYLVNLEGPSSMMIESSPAEVELSVDTDVKDYVPVWGWAVHTSAVTAFEYAIDGGEYLPMDCTYGADVEAATPSYPAADVHRFALDVPIAGLTSGKHTLSVRGICKDNNRFVVAIFTLNVTASTYHSDIDVPDGPGVYNECIEVSDSVTVSTLTQEYHISGWSVHSRDIVEFVYAIDNGTTQPLNSFYREDVASAVPDYSFCAVNGYNGDITIGNLSTGTHTITVKGLTGNNAYYDVAVITLNITSIVNVNYDDIVVESGDANIDTAEGIITGIAPNTTAQQLISSISHGVITDKDGNEVTTDKLASGYILQGYDEVGTLREEYIIIVTGDVYGDGIVNAKDVIAAKLLKSGKNAGYSRAVDTDGNGVITSAELTAVSRTVAEQ